MNNELTINDLFEFDKEQFFAHKSPDGNWYLIRHEDLKNTDLDYIFECYLITDKAIFKHPYHLTRNEIGIQ